MRALVPGSLDISHLRFGAPDWLPLLVVPAVCAVLIAWRFSRRVGDARRLRRARSVPVRERISRIGDLVFWGCLAGALACTIVALARPQAVVALIRTAGIDVVILQDGSASMRVADVRGDRWQRSVAFLRRRRGPALEGRPYRASRCRQHRDAADPPDARSQHVLLPRPSRRSRFACLTTGRGHEHRAGIHWGLRD
jgi:hypothetical protein